MYSIFSQFLIDCWNREHPKQRTDVPAEIIKMLHKEFDENSPLCITTTPFVLWCNTISTLDYIAEDASKELWTNKELLKILRWIEKNIILKIECDKISTIHVKIRIAVDMLNKLQFNGTISKDLNLFYFHNVVSNCLDLYFDVFGSNTNNELPF